MKNLYLLFGLSALLSIQAFGDDCTVSEPSSMPTLCIGTQISPTITHTTAEATGIGTATGLPLGVTAVWADNTITISGTPTQSGTFNYTIPLSGCEAVNATGTIKVTDNNTVASGMNQTRCVNTPLTPISLATTGATGATVTGLPAGVNGVWASNVVKISGVPLTSGSFPYTVTLTGGCGTIITTGTITVPATNTVAAGTNQTRCVNTALTPISLATTGATGATVTGLPPGVNGVWASNVLKISGIPLTSGSFPYTVTLTGGCGTIITTGTITVLDSNTVAAGTNQTKCVNTAITPITLATTGATGATVTGLPAGVTGTWSGNVVTISGTPTVSGSFTYTVTLIGGCGTIITTGTITIIAGNTVAAGTNQTRCVNTALTPIILATTGATGATVTGLPAGLTGTWSANVVTISGTPTESGSFTYTVTLTGGCGAANSTGTITVNPIPSFMVEGLTAGSLAVCEGAPLGLSVSSSAGLGITWDRPIGSNYTVFNIANMPSTLNDDGNWITTVTILATGCSTTKPFVVNVDPKFKIIPQPNADRQFCVGASEVINLDSLINFQTITTSTSIPFNQVTINSWQIGNVNLNTSIGDVDNSPSLQGLDRPLAVTAHRGECTAALETVIFVDVAIGPLFGVSTAVDNYCAGEELQLSMIETSTATGDNGATIKYTWNYNGVSGEFPGPELPGGIISSSNPGNVNFSAKYEYYPLNGQFSCQGTTPQSKIIFVTPAYLPILTVEQNYCQEAVQNITSSSVVNIQSDQYPISQTAALNQFSITTPSGTSEVVNFGNDFDNFFAQPSIEYQPGIWTLNYTLNFGNCQRSANASFTVNPFPATIASTTYYCETAEPIDLNDLVNDFSELYYTDTADYNVSTQFGDISQMMFFIPDTVGIAIEGENTVTIKYNETIVDNLGCIVPDDNLFKLIFYPEIITSLMDDTLVLCFAMDDVVGLGNMPIGGDGYFSYKWMAEEVNLATSSSSTIMLGSNFTYTQELKLTTKSPNTGNTEDPQFGVCSTIDTIHLFINKSPVTASSPSFSDYCLLQPSTMTISNWSVQSGFNTEAIKMSFYDGLPQIDTELDLVMEPDPLLEWVFEWNGGTFSKDSILYPEELNGATSLPDSLFYTVGFYLDPVHNCPIYSSTAGVNFNYFDAISTSQPSPLITSSTNFEACNGGSITLGGVSIVNGVISDDSLRWEVSGGLLYTINPSDSNAIDIAIPENFADSTFVVTLTQESEACETDFVANISLNSGGLSPSPQEYFSDAVSNTIIYNDSAVCYQWGYIATSGSGANTMSFFAQFDGQTYQSFDLNWNGIPVGVTRDDIICKVFLKDEAGGCSDTTCVTIAPKNLTSTKPDAGSIITDDLITLYPNPNTGQFQVALRDLLQDRIYHLEVYNILGQSIWNQSFVSKDENYDLSLVMPSVGNGMYILSLLIEDRPVARIPFIINR